MAATPSCPNCGSTLAPAVISCARCGFRLAEPAPVEAAPVGPPLEKASTQSGNSLDLSQMFGEFRDRCAREFSAMQDRWAIEKSTLFLAGLGMAGLAFLIATIAGTSLLTADTDAVGRRMDGAVWLQLALGLALGAAALAVYIRWQSGPPKESRASDRDFVAGAALAGLTVIFSLLGLFKGFDGSSSGVDAWFRYANVYAVLAVAIFAIARPIPRTVQTTPSTTIGLGAVGVAAGALVIGQILGLSNDRDTFATGVAFQALGIVAMTLAIGWFLGLKPSR